MSLLKEDARRLKGLFPFESSKSRRKKIFHVLDGISGVSFSDIQVMSVADLNDLYKRLMEKRKKRKNRIEDMD